MQPAPLVSVVIAESDTRRVETALRSWRDQDLEALEILWIVDETVVDPDFDRVRGADDRVRIVRVPPTTSAASARRLGLEQAAAPLTLIARAGVHVPPAAARVAAMTSSDDDSDLIVLFDDATGTTLPPVMAEEDIVRHLFPENDPLTADGVLLFVRTDLIRRVADELGDGDRTERFTAGMFLAVALADRASSRALEGIRTPSSGDHHASARGEAEIAFGDVDALTTIEGPVRKRAREIPNPEPLLEGFRSVRLAFIARSIRALTSDGVPRQLLEVLHARVNPLDVVLAASEFVPEFLAVLAQNGERVELAAGPRSVLLTTNILTTGGVSGVLLAQARILRDAGHRVTIATHRAGSDPSAAPDGVTVEHLTATTPRDRLLQWAEICRRNEIDTVIDHRILYSRDWPGYALAARALGAATIGWIHNFAGRPTYNGNELHSLLRQHLGALAQLIVLSPLDVAFWKLRGIERVAYLPNPPSPMLLDTPDDARAKPRPEGRLELIWWGRLEEHTKKVSELVEVAAQLKALGTRFRMTIVGPDWADMTRDRLNALASERGVADLVEAVGPRRGDDLLAAIDSAHLFVNTSIIEGYPLTLPEAQSRGLPVAMYDLPWLAFLQDNDGVVTAPQGNARALAVRIAELAKDGERYEAMSAASLAAARRAASADFADLYGRLLSGTLPSTHSPEPTLEDARRSLDLLLFFAENRAPRQAPRPRADRRLPPATTRGRFERKFTPSAHRVLAIAPWLRPLARRVKHLLLR